MRLILAAFLVSAVAAPASALPPAGRDPLAAASFAEIVTVAAKRKAPPARPPRKSRDSGAASGIHPLVGSGEY